MKKTLLYSSILFGSILLNQQALAQQVNTVNLPNTGSTHKNIKARLMNSAIRQDLAEAETWEQKYADFKKMLSDKYGFSYSLDASILPQRGAPNGKKTSWQTQYYGTANWNMMQSDTYGDLSAQIAYTKVQYWGTSATDIGNNMGVVSGINDYTDNSHSFDQLTLTYQFPSYMKWLSLTAGQFPIYTFDGTSYNANQQINFLNYALSQNGSSAYPTASLGAYATVAPNDDWSFVVGFQDAHNVTGQNISTKDFDKKKYTTFASVSYTPTIEGWGTSQYSIMVYNQPSVPQQPEHTKGWSINAMQNIGQIGIFARANGATNSPEPIKQSYMVGTVWNNPLKRNALDQIGLAYSLNKLNKAVNGTPSRSVENVIEAYWSWGISNYLIITPDIQFYINPGLNEKSNTATVTSLRATVMF